MKLHSLKSLNPIPTGEGGGKFNPPPIVFYITQKVLVWDCWNFLTVSKLALPVSQNWAFILTAGVLRHTALKTTFSCNKLNLCFYPLSVVRFWSFLAFWIAYDKRKRNGQVLKRFLFKLFAYSRSNEISSFLVFLNYTSGYLKFC